MYTLRICSVLMMFVQRTVAIVPYIRIHEFIFDTPSQVGLGREIGLEALLPCYCIYVFLLPTSHFKGAGVFRNLSPFCDECKNF